MLNTEASAGAIDVSVDIILAWEGPRDSERQEHRPCCFGAFAANSIRETERQKQEHQTWRSYESVAEVARKVQTPALEPAWG